MCGRGLPVAVLCVVGLAASVHAQQISWADAADGDWGDLSSWNPENVPNSPGEDAILGFKSAYQAILDGSFSIGELHVMNPLATVRIDPSHTLTLNGPLSTNNGVIALNPFASATNSILTIGQSTSLSGTGEIWMQTSADNSQIFTLPDQTLTHGIDHTIRGVGQILAAIDNDGTIVADVGVSVAGTQLDLFGADKSNQGTIGAFDQATVRLTDHTLDQTGGGDLQAFDGGTVGLGGGLTVLGGTLSTSGAGVMTTIGSPTLIDVTNVNTTWIAPAHTVTVFDGLTNTGTIEMNRNASAANAILTFAETDVLDGNGEIWMRTSGDNTQLLTPDGVVMTHGANHTIRGVGLFSAAVENLGQIIADVGVSVSGTQLDMFGGDKVNMGTMSARDGSIVSLTACIVDQSQEGGGGGILADGGTVRLGSDLTVIGGTLSSDGAGVVETSGSPVLAGVTTTGTTWFNPAHTVTILDGLTNNTTIEMNRQGSGANSILTFPESQSLGGTGEVWMRTSGDNSQITTGEGATLTHGADHSIRGVGSITASLINDGEIVADSSVSVSGTELDVFGSTKFNMGTMAAASGSFLDLTGFALDQTGGGQLTAFDGGTIRIGGDLLISGGAFDAEGSGVLSTFGPSMLTDLTLNGPMLHNASHTVTLLDPGLRNESVIEMNPQGSGANATLFVAEDATIDGAGEIQMRTSGDNSDIRTAEGATLTHGADHTIRGVGFLGAAMVNDGEVRADVSVSVSGNTLAVFGGDKLNTSTFSVAPGSFLDLSDVFFDQAPGGTLRADGGTVRVGNGVTITGGAFVSNDDGLFSTTGSPTVQDLTFHGPANVNAGHTMTVLGDLENNGLMQANPQNSGADAVIFFPASATLDGAGEISLFTVAENARISGEKGVTVTNGPDHTLSGIGQCTTDLVNNGRIAPGKDGVGTFNATADFENGADGVIEIDFFDDQVGDRIAVGGLATLGGTVEMIVPDDYVANPCDTITILTAEMIEGEFDELIQPDLFPLFRYRLFYTQTSVELRATCLADLNADCELNILDFVTFQELWQEMDPQADCDGNGQFNILDFVCFQVQFQGPCQ